MRRHLHSPPSAPDSGVASLSPSPSLPLPPLARRRHLLCPAASHPPGLPPPPPPSRRRLPPIPATPPPSSPQSLSLPHPSPYGLSLPPSALMATSRSYPSLPTFSPDRHRLLVAAAIASLPFPFRIATTSLSSNGHLSVLPVVAYFQSQPPPPLPPLAAAAASPFPLLDRRCRLPQPQWPPHGPSRRRRLC